MAQLHTGQTTASMGAFAPLGSDANAHQTICSSIDVNIKGEYKFLVI